MNASKYNNERLKIMFSETGHNHPKINAVSAILLFINSHKCSYYTMVYSYYSSNGSALLHYSNVLLLLLKGTSKA